MRREKISISHRPQKGASSTEKQDRLHEQFYSTGGVFVADGE